MKHGPIKKILNKASASYSKGVWESNDLFNRVNQILMLNNNLQITW